MSNNVLEIDPVKIMRKYTKSRTSIDYRAQGVYVKSTMSFKENIENLPTNATLRMTVVRTVSARSISKL